MVQLLLGFILGILVFIGYGAWRALHSDGWDDSNLFNWLRVLSQIYIHPEQLGTLYQLTDTQILWVLNDASPNRELFRPFWYISKDEFEGVVKTRM